MAIRTSKLVRGERRDCFSRGSSQEIQYAVLSSRVQWTSEPGVER